MPKHKNLNRHKTKRARRKSATWRKTQAHYEWHAAEARRKEGNDAEGSPAHLPHRSAIPAVASPSVGQKEGPAIAAPVKVG